MPVGSEEIALQSLSPEEGFHKVFMGYLFRVGAVGAVGWPLLSHHGQSLSFLAFYWDSFSYTGTPTTTRAAILLHPYQ